MTSRKYARVDVPAGTKTIEADSYEPDFEGECEACGAPASEQPLVTVVKHGRTIARIGLCGPCTWGEAAMLNPREWNR